MLISDPDNMKEALRLAYAEIERLRGVLKSISEARPHHYQMAFEDHSTFAIRLKQTALAALQQS